MFLDNPLASDADASDRDLGLAQAECALAIGRLDGLLTALAPAEITLFCMALLRTTLLSALSQAGFLDAELRFDNWFSGLDRGPEETALTSCSAHAVVRALLSELGRHPWQPLAEAAQTIAKAARFSTDRPGNTADQLATDAIEAARKLIARAGAGAQSPLPFAGLSLVGNLLREDPMFAPLERETRVLALPGRHVSLERAAARTPLWAVDAVLGRLFAAGGICRHALPFPGAVTAECLAGHLRPNERSILEARALGSSAQRLTKLAEASRNQIIVMQDRLAHLRSSARAPQVWLLLAGFSTLGIDQLGTAFGVSRRGTYAVGNALVAAGVARRETVKGRVFLVAEELRPKSRLPLSQDSAPVPTAALEEFDAAMARIDMLLAGRHEGDLHN